MYGILYFINNNTVYAAICLVIGYDSIQNELGNFIIDFIKYRFRYDGINEKINIEHTSIKKYIVITGNRGFFFFLVFPIIGGDVFYRYGKRTRITSTLQV